MVVPPTAISDRDRVSETLDRLLEFMECVRRHAFFRCRCRFEIYNFTRFGQYRVRTYALGMKRRKAGSMCEAPGGPPGTRWNREKNSL